MATFEVVEKSSKGNSGSPEYGCSAENLGIGNDLMTS